MSTHRRQRQDVSAIEAASTGVTLRTRGLLVASVIIVLLFIFGAAGSALRKPITQGFDEIAHISYVAYLQTTRPSWPHLEQMRMIDPDTFEFTSEENYLNHPPIYYWLIAALGPEIRAHPSTLIFLRLLNVAIGALGVIGLLALAARMKLRHLEFYAFAAMTVATPVLAPLAGSVNNDNLAFAGGVFTTLGAYAYVASHRRSWLIISCCGMLVASITKLTALLLLSGFLAVLLVLMAMKQTTNRIDAAIVVVTLIAAAMPYIVFFQQYGSPAPNTPAHLFVMRKGAEVAGWNGEPRMDAVTYTIFFLKNFLMEWMPSLHPRSGLQLALLILPVATLALAAMGAAMSTRAFMAGRSGPSAPVVVAGMLAIVVTLAIHIMFSYQRHLQTGWMMDAYPRYYLPAIAIVPMGAFIFTCAIRSPKTRTLLLSFLVAAPLIFKLFGAPLG
jgi:hypothetical protein